MVKLIPLQGQLQDWRSNNSMSDVEIRRRRFLIGSGSDCAMCCRSDRISPHHCQLRLEPERVVLEDLASETGTFVNDRRVEHVCVLHEGDRLRIGRLEFEVLIEDLTPVWEVGPRVAGDTLHDVMADTFCDLLISADEKDRARRLQNPESRQFTMPPTDAATRQPEKRSSSLGREGEPSRRTAKVKQGRLPAKPRQQEDAQTAAAELLHSYFTTRKVYAPLRRSCRNAASDNSPGPSNRADDTPDQTAHQQ
jgi:pSer/pThr/pTyr-binding forkhead associated (FHA) protein